MTEPICERTRAELSAMRDLELVLSPAATAHLDGCEQCVDFGTRLAQLDEKLGRGDTAHAPDVSSRVMAQLSKAPSRWWSVAAAALVGIIAGAVIGGVGTSLERVRAGDLGELFRAAGPAVESLGAEVLVVERGWHPLVDERVYVGSMAYTAPEDLEISLVDTTSYPGEEWQPNDVLVRHADGDFLAVAAPPCPVAALPACLRPASAMAIEGLRPFDEGVVAPLAMVGPGRVLNRWGGVEVIGAPSLKGRPTIQVETTVAAAEQVQALTRHGAWRDFHPGDRVVMWLDEETLLPLRTEVFATTSPERRLWALRRGYEDGTSDPILVVELTLTTGTEIAPPQLADDTRSAGFVVGPVEMDLPDVGSQLSLYRTGSWRLPDGAPVEVASWSDGRAWLRVESTTGWDEPHLFGISASFAEPVDLRPGSVGYLSPDGSALSLHGDGVDTVITGTVPVEDLERVAASLPFAGRSIPPDWGQAGVVEGTALPEGVLTPDIEGWSVLGDIDGDRTTLLLTGAGRSSVVVTQEPGDRLAPPDGPDFVVVEIAEVTARFDASAQVLEWVDEGRVITLRSETVGLSDLEQIAESMLR